MTADENKHRAKDVVGLLEGLSTTRAIRRYVDAPIPEDVLRDIMFAATRAPSGSNNQPSSGGVAITAESIKKACTTAGIADCTAIVKLMMDGMASGKPPDAQAMNKLLGNKMDAFLKAMGFPSQPSTSK